MSKVYFALSNHSKSHFLPTSDRITDDDDDDDDARRDAASAPFVIAGRRRRRRMSTVTVTVQIKQLENMQL